MKNMKNIEREKVDLKMWAAVGLSRRSATPNLPAHPIPLPSVLKPLHFLLAPPSLVLVGLWSDPVTNSMIGCVSSVSREGARSVPPRRLTGMKRVTASSPPVCSLLCFSPFSSFGHNFRSSPSCSHGLRRSDETEELVGDLSPSLSDNNHGFL
ncbi:hypothetical protein F2Q70_00013372 [Brassica cretica]|uniref:Uncharacterized protein n=1 Tax=Brassica cretica TaxID=69181 RepID=A0A8S9M5A2_BRACR|nr:hypothetical protein F2Q70_00013372 [Brassica cretica]